MKRRGLKQGVAGNQGDSRRSWSSPSTRLVAARLLLLFCEGGDDPSRGSCCLRHTSFRFWLTNIFRQSSVLARSRTGTAATMQRMAPVDWAVLETACLPLWLPASRPGVGVLITLRVMRVPLAEREDYISLAASHSSRLG